MTRKTIFLSIQATSHIGAFVNMLVLVKHKILNGKKNVTSLILTRLCEKNWISKARNEKRRLLLPPSQLSVLLISFLVCPNKSASFYI